MRILLAEDEKELSNALCAVIKHNNYSVDPVYNGEDAYDYGKDPNYDVIVLDIMMPKMNGIDVLKKLRSEGIKTPVIMLTAKSELEDKITGLDAGADDYLTKPFAMGELLARLRAISRRKEDYVPSIVRIGNVSLNKDNFELSTDKGVVHLGNKEYQMMEMFMTSPKRIITTETFMDRIWGYDSETEINVVWVYISYLRKKLVSLEATVELKSVRGAGYMLDEKQN